MSKQSQQNKEIQKMLAEADSLLAQLSTVVDEALTLTKATDDDKHT